MSLIKKIQQKFLEKSNSYNYYKNKNTQLIKQNKKNQIIIKQLQEENNKLLEITYNNTEQKQNITQIKNQIKKIQEQQIINNNLQQNLNIAQGENTRLIKKITQENNDAIKIKQNLNNLQENIEYTKEIVQQNRKNNANILFLQQQLKSSIQLHEAHQKLLKEIRDTNEKNKQMLTRLLELKNLINQNYKILKHNNTMLIKNHNNTDMLEKNKETNIILEKNMYYLNLKLERIIDEYKINQEK